jgi:acyl-coenzyme A thioesterase PaaI-like protein
MGCAIHSTLAVGERYTTLEVKANFVRPITVIPAACDARPSSGATVSTAEGKVVAVSSGKLLAHGTTTCLIAPAR